MSTAALWVIPLIFAVVFWALLPVFAPVKAAQNVTDEVRRARREQLAQEIADLELDHKVGRIETADYHAERQTRLQELGEILQAESPGPQA